MRFQANNVDFSKCHRAILFASYEQRCVEVAKHLAQARYDGDVVVFFCDDLPSKDIPNNVQTIGNLVGARMRAIPVSYSDPTPMIRAVNQLTSVDSVLVDVSCFNRGNLFPFLWASGLGKTTFPEVSFGYVPPENYGDWLSRDHDVPRNIVGFPGSIEFPKDRLLVCVVGYEIERALTVVAAAEPSRVVLTVGSIPTREDFFARNRRTVELIHGSTEYDIIPINVSDPESCMNDLRAILRGTTKDTAIGFAPFSTKLSCLAVWGLWLENKSIRIWNAQPAVYNMLSYSKGSLQPLYFSVDWISA